MRRMHVVGALLGVVAGMGALAVGEQDARACGGCFTPQPPPNETQTLSVITGEQMILSISTTQTTLYDQINYSGSPSSFAWVLPIKGAVTVGLSADILFQTINQLTATTLVSPPENCPAAPTCGGAGAGCNSSSASATVGVPSVGGFSADGNASGAPTVTVTSQKQVGPYETVQLHSNDGSALNNWLTAHGYEIPASTKPVIDAYVAGHFDFLALKLVPGEGVQSMQPVRVTTQGAAPSLPLHMVAVGTGPTTGITIWVVADGRWAPSNFPTFTLGPSDLAWDWATASSNYETVRLAKEASYNGRAWQIESSLELSQYTITENLLDNIEYDPTGPAGGYLPAQATNASDAGVADAGAHDAGHVVDAARVDSGAASDAGADGSDVDDGGESYDAGDDESGAYDAAFYGDASDGGAAGEAANADLAVLFEGIAQPNVRITRMRSDIAKAALSTDMILEATSDQSELTNQYTITNEIGEPLCPVYDTSTCQQTGTEPRSQAAAAASASSSGCSTTRLRDGSGTTVAILLALGGVSLVRGRRKRRSA